MKGHVYHCFHGAWKCPVQAPLSLMWPHDRNCVWISNKLIVLRPITSIMGFIAFLSSPCNFQQGPSPQLMWNICSRLIYWSLAMFVFSLSCRSLILGVELLPPVTTFLSYSDYCGLHWLVLSAEALHRKVSSSRRLNVRMRVSSCTGHSDSAVLSSRNYDKFYNGRPQNTLWIKIQNP